MIPGTLERLLHPGDNIPPSPLNTGDKIRLLSLIVRGMAELHAIGLVHGDIKPANVLLNNKSPPDIRIADFGLSYLKEEIMQTQVKIA